MTYVYTRRNPFLSKRSQLSICSTAYPVMFNRVSVMTVKLSQTVLQDSRDSTPSRSTAGTLYIAYVHRTGTQAVLLTYRVHRAERGTKTKKLKVNDSLTFLHTIASPSHQTVKHEVYTGCRSINLFYMPTKYSSNIT